MMLEISVINSILYTLSHTLIMAVRVMRIHWPIPIILPACGPNTNVWHKMGGLI